MPTSPSQIARGTAKWAVTLAPLLLLQIFATACTSAATLPELFPALAGLPNATTLAIELGWQGLSLMSPTEAEYRLQLHDDQFEGQARFKVATATTTRSVVVPRDLVRAFLVASTNVNMVEKDYQPRTTHTDDYPSVAVIVPAKEGELRIETQSQPQQSRSGKYWDATPWAIRYLGRTFVVTADDLDQALDPLWPRLQYDEVTAELAKQVRSSNSQGR